MTLGLNEQLMQGYWGSSDSGRPARRQQPQESTGLLDGSETAFSAVDLLGSQHQEQQELAQRMQLGSMFRCTCGSGLGYSGSASFGGPLNTGQFTPGQGISNGSALDVARSYLGVNESQHGNFINNTFSRGQDRAWCADFVSTCMRQSGGSPWGHIASVRGIHDWAAQNGRLTNAPRPGDVILLRGARGNLGHTGFVEKIENGYVHTIEGNTGNAVKRRRYRIDSDQVQGFVSGARATA